MARSARAPSQARPALTTALSLTVLATVSPSPTRIRSPSRRRATCHRTPTTRTPSPKSCSGCGGKGSLMCRASPSSCSTRRFCGSWVHRKAPVLQKYLYERQKCEYILIILIKSVNSALPLRLSCRKPQSMECSQREQYARITSCGATEFRFNVDCGSKLIITNGPKGKRLMRAYDWTRMPFLHRIFLRGFIPVYDTGSDKYIASRLSLGASCVLPA